MRIRRGGPPGVHRRDARSRRSAQAGRQAGGHRMSRGALRRRARHGAAGGGRRRRLRRRERSRGSGPQAQAGRRARPARAAASCAGRSVGVRQGGRGVRPRMRLLRDPVVPREAAFARAGDDRRGSPRARRARRGRARARGPGPRVVRTRRRPARLAGAAPPAPGRALGARSGAHPASLSLSERSARSTRVDDARPADGGAVLRPVTPARVCATASAHEAMGGRRPVPRSRRRHPRPRA